MKQVVQRLKDGRIEILDVPVPELERGGVLVDVRASLVSAGTERTQVATARRSLIGKAMARPDQAREVVEKARRDGIADTVRAVQTRLSQPSPLGYSSAGVALAVGELVSDVRPGDRVACGGGGYAVHAEMQHVPQNLCVRVPDGIGFDEAAFATIGAVALHGIRQAGVTVGERVGVIGLGLLGQLTGQLVRASGAVALGTDLDAELVEAAKRNGAVDAAFIRGALDADSLPDDLKACDSVIVTAATSSSDPILLAAGLLRDRGRIVVVGDVSLDVPRAVLYDKEIELRLSRSYGPGRYDREYEERGLDYPIGYVRWTERRNMAAFLDLVAAGKLRPSDLINERVPIERADEAYERLVGSTRSPLALLIEYAPTRAPERATRRQDVTVAKHGVASVIGAGSFATRILIPGLVRAGFELEAIASSSGVSATAAAERFGFRRATATPELIDDPATGLIAIATRHGSHARLATAALQAGKAVFVEKPPALSRKELEALRMTRDQSGLPVAVGFNRRFAPLARELRAFIRPFDQPIELLYRVSAGRLPDDHWLNDPEEGGGRLLGEGCHFVDFACWLVGALPLRVHSVLAPASGAPVSAAQRFTVTLEFSDGSLATIVYGAAGAPRLGKEYIEAHTAGRSAILDDFRSLVCHDGRRRRRSHRDRGGDKGHVAQFEALHATLMGEHVDGPDPLDTMSVTLAALESGITGLRESVQDARSPESDRPSGSGCRQHLADEQF